MENNLSAKSKTVRRRVTLFLALLSSRDCQRACAQHLSSEKLAFELCRLWFDQVYLPSTRYLDALKGDQSAKEVERFRACFTEEEQAALERFHRFFELRMEMLPEEARNRKIFPQNDLWISITRDASHLLEELEPNAERLRQQLFWIVQIALEARDEG